VSFRLIKNRNAPSGQKGYALKKSVAAGPTSGEMRASLDEIVREGAQRMLQAALEAEIEEFVVRHAGVTDDRGRRQVVRNGYLPEREVATGAGPLSVRQPRARDLRGETAPDERIRFTSSILPRYLRRSESLDELVPWLYLRGLSTNEFPDALRALLGPDAKGLSPSVVTRLAKSWEAEYEAWARRDLSDREYVYVWVDGIHFNVRLEEERQCMLVVIGATRDGRKELVGLLDGYRESEQSWKELLLDLKARGLKRPPKLAVGDGALGFWKALRQVFPDAVRLRHRRTKGSGSRRACLAMVFMLARAAQRRWRKLNGAARLLQLIQGERFVNGVHERNVA